MPGLDIPNQMAVRDLLKEAYAFVGETWAIFAKILNEGETDRAFKQDASVLEEMTRTKKTDGIERPRKVISKRFAVKLITFCKAESGFTVSGKLAERLGSLWEPLATSQGTVNLSDAGRLGGFISALGLNDDVAMRSIRRFFGKYLHFALNEDGLIVTTRCALSNERGSDGAPIYKTERWYSEFGLVEAAGVYFCEDNNLYLLASPEGHVDLRLSIFNVLSSSSMRSKQPQEILRGMALGVNPKKTILSSRCILIRPECVEPEVANQLWDEPATKDSFKIINANPQSFKTQFQEIAEYLYGEESVDYIKLIMLAAPG